jgi:hypothetical protein
MEEDDDPEEMTTAPLSPEETPPSPDETVIAPDTSLVDWPEEIVT